MFNKQNIETILIVIALIIWTPLLGAGLHFLMYGYVW